MCGAGRDFMTNRATVSGVVAGVLLFGVAISGADRPAPQASRVESRLQTAPQPSAEKQSSDAALGHYLFRTYCASCHGITARGDGPLAGAMRRRPSNLTEIAQRNEGVYPSELVYKIIDGRVGVRGHGGPDMPVWGDAFMRTSETTDEASVRRRIQALVAYLATVQARDTR